MISLGFFRILELEFNERLIFPMMQRFDFQASENEFMMLNDRPNHIEKKEAEFDGCYLRRWSSTPVRVTGTIYHGHNWHHHTKVLFLAKRVEGLKGKLPPCAVRPK